MINKFSLLFCIFLCGQLVGYAQEHIVTEINANDLIGTWYPTYDATKSAVSFKKRRNSHRNYGLRLEFLESGEFRSRYSARCGNDSMFRTQNYSGIWILDEEDWILTTSEPIVRKGTTFKIAKLDTDKMVLVRTGIE